MLPLTVTSQFARSTTPLGTISVPPMFTFVNCRCCLPASMEKPAGVVRSIVLPAGTVRAPAEPSP